MALKLSVVTPESDVLSVEADEVMVPGASGEIGLLPGHVELISALKPGTLTAIRGGKRTYYVVNSGFVELSHDQVSVLTDTCEDATQVDVKRAETALIGALERLKTLGPTDPGFGESERRAAIARARLEGASRAGATVAIPG
jgi:F-type H+-transporting ATPase subunit epsilon